MSTTEPESYSDHETPPKLVSVQFHLPESFSFSSYERDPTPAVWIRHTDDSRLIVIGQDSHTGPDEYRVTYGVSGEDPVVNSVYDSLAEAVFRAETLAWQHA